MSRVPKTRKADASNADHTRQALVEAALRLFGRVGYDGASTRQIAAAAKANIGSIAYHFGGKEGLRLAVADHIIDLMQGIAAQAAASAPPATSPEAAEAQLMAALERMIAFIVAAPQAADVAPFVLREMSAPTEAFERIYAGVFEPLHRRFCGVWELATGQPAENDETKLSIFTAIGQVIYFRIAREAVKRRMGWADMGPAEAKMIAAVCRDNIHAAIGARRKART